jgi:TPR repeat protein
VSVTTFEVKNGSEALKRKDYASALRWFLKDQKNPVAQFNVGWIYRDGLGVKQDFTEALKWFEMAAAQGNAPAQDYIGKMYHDGLGVRQDYAAAMSWSMKAAARDFMAAQLRIAGMYMNGEGVTQDYAATLTWFRKAAEADIEAQIGIDDEMATGWKAGAQFTVGRMFEAGMGTPKDIAQAINWYRSAAALGSAKAKAKLAELQASPAGFDITLWCDQPTLGGGTIKSLVSIDTKSKYVKFETPLQETIELRDGFFGKAITSGYMAAESTKVQQFVVIADNSVRFGFRDSKAVVHEYTIDLGTGILRISGRITQCRTASSGR